MRAVGAGICLVLATAQVLAQSAPPAAAADGPDRPPRPYGTADGARAVTGAASGDRAPSLSPGTYTDVLSAGERKHYRVPLDDRSHAYVSAVLAPPPGGTVAATDGMRIGLADPGGTRCSDGTDVTFGADTPRPVADYATRRIGPGRGCQAEGEYVFTVEAIGADFGDGDRSGASEGSGARTWPVEIRFMLEPGLKAGSSAPSADGPGRGRSPQLPQGAPKGAEGGTGFNDARALGQGRWRDELNPGDSRYYKVPLDWGQRLFLDATFGYGGGDGDGSGSPRDGQKVPDGVQLALYNTARGFVESVDADHPDRSVTLDTAPVAFDNRIVKGNEVGAMRFSGWYYVRVSLARDVAGPTPLTLGVGIEGEPAAAPPYDGDPLAAGFGVTAGDRLGVRASGPAGDSGGSAAMRIVGYSGIGLGTALVLGLVGWTAVARRSRAQAANPWER
ncbi:hypothetical protein [Streptomyces sp. NPDC048057]|uniref:hypothetical protein n=1 Tax=Streptomyces sp. NPDC048057 TaxID=3155628 RepID=UPI0033DB3B12